MDIAEILILHKNHVVDEWTRRLRTEVSPCFAARPIEEVAAAVSEAADANFEVLVNGDHSRIDTFIKKMGRVRSRAAFSLSDVQKAFELYRSILMPLLVKTLDRDALVGRLDGLNLCLSYTIRRFTEYFQLLHERETEGYAHALEAEVERRTGQLRESENKFRDLAEKAPVGMYLLQDGVFLYVNSRLAEIQGYTTEEITRKLGPRDIVLPEDWPAVEEYIQRRIAGEVQSFYSEFRTVRKNGEIRNVEVYSSSTTYRGKPAVIGTFLDNTERKRTEEALKNSEKRYHGLFENLRDGFAAVNMERKITEANPSFQAMVGYSREELSEMTYDAITPAEWHVFEDKIVAKQVMKRGYSDVYEKEYIRKDGVVFPVEVRAHLKRDEDGNPEEMWGFMRDITERNEAEKALRDGELKYRTLFESSNDAIFLMRNDRCVDCNSKTLKMFRCTKGQFVGRRPYAFSPPLQPDGSESSEKAAAKIRAAMRGRLQFFEWKHCRPDGTVFDAEVSLNCIELEGKPILQGIIRDITKRKEYEEELRNKSLALEDANAALRVLLQQREMDREELEQKILHNSKELVFPYIDKLKQFRLDARLRSYLGVLEANLKNIMSPFVHQMTSININFTPAEIKVAHLIRDGKTVKEIADMLGVSVSAINLHRQHLRNKLGLNSVKVNLRTYLMSSFPQ